MKFSKSGILTISGMLVANSFLLMATTYAASSKDILTDPAHAEQKIWAINFIEDDQGKTCSLILFDISWSMKDCDRNNGNKSCGDTHYINPETWPHKKWDAAVNWALTYSENFLSWNSNARIWLVLFWDKAYYGDKNSTRSAGDYKGTPQKCMYNQTSCTYWQKLSNENLDINNFWYPTEYTYLGKWLKKAQSIFKSNDAKDCSKKIIVIITDWVPTDLKTATWTAKQLNNSGVIIYSLGYKMYWNWATNLWEISKWLFYNADESNVSKIFEKIAWWAYETNGISTENNKLKVVSENLILQDWEHINSIEGNSQHSSILWWNSNNITSSDTSTIIAWEWNSIQISQNSSILWWKLNRIINDGNENNIIMWWISNKILNWKYSSIPWWSWNIVNWDYSITIWNNNSIEWNHSVAMWNWTKIIGNNSFYWTDYAHRATTLKADNVFSILSHSGMVINTETPHPKAQLTISWTLIVRENVEDTTVNCGNGKWKGILKAVKKNNGETCFCTCDWKNWRSMYNWSCESLCDTKMKPVCWTKVTLECNGWKYVFSGSCNSWKVINTSYYVSNDGKKVHWTCQTYDGQTQNCSGLTPTTKPNWWNCPSNTSTPNPGCQIKLKLEVDGKEAGHWEQHNYINGLDSQVLETNITFNCDKGICDWSKMNICSDCGDEPNWMRENSDVNNILSVIKGVGHPGISVKDGYEYVGWYRNGSPLNIIDIQWIEEKHLTCNSTLTLKIKSKTQWGGSTCTSRPETCPKICESPARSFGLDSPNYGNGTSNDPLVQISSYITECNNSCGTPATETCNNVTWVNCCYESK